MSARATPSQAARSRTASGGSVAGRSVAAATSALAAANVRRWLRPRPVWDASSAAAAASTRAPAGGGTARSSGTRAPPAAPPVRQRRPRLARGDPLGVAPAERVGGDAAEVGEVAVAIGLRPVGIEIL